MGHPEGKDAKKTIVPAANPELWEFSIGAGLTRSDFDFQFNTPSPFGKSSGGKKSSSTSGSEWTVFPYVALDRELWRSDDWSLRMGLGYSYLHTDSDSGVVRARRDSAFDSTHGEGSRVASYVRTQVELDAHEISLPISIRRDFGKRLHAEITVAPTITILAFDGQTDVRRRGSTSLAGNPATGFSGDGQGGAPGGGGPFSNPGGPLSGGSVPGVSVSSSSNGAVTGGGNLSGGKVSSHKVYAGSSTDARFGFDGTLSVLYDLNASGTFFAELWGRYHWVDRCTLNSGFGNTEVDLSGFQCGVGVGVRF